MSSLNRWVGYVRAKVRDVTRSMNKDLDRREAELEVERAEKPWLRDEGDVPSFEDVQAKIDARSAKAVGAEPSSPPAKASGDPAFDLAVRQKAADDRLADIRKSLGVDPDAEK